MEINTFNEKEKYKNFQIELENAYDKFPIKIEYKVTSHSKFPQERWLTITDSGIGMTREVIERFLLKIGRSRWGNDPMISRLGIGNLTIGTFGIGFLSTLMIADMVVVETSSCLPNQSGIRATIYGWQGFLGTEPFETDKPGTSIKMRLRDESFQSINELIAIIAEIAPAIDFPIKFKHEDSMLDVPRLDLNNLRNNKNTQAKFNLDDSGSFFTIIESGKRIEMWDGDKLVIDEIKKRKRQTIVCQDGINIGEMPYPQDDDDESSILRDLQIFVSLKGKSRIPLDLSRNIAEGGYQYFWDKFKPKIFNIICKNHIVNDVAFKTISTLVERRFFQKDLGDPSLFCEYGGVLLRGLNDINHIEEITVIEANRKEDREILRNEKTVAWLAPIPREENEFSTGFDLDKKGEYYGKEGGIATKSYYLTRGFDNVLDLDKVSAVNKLSTKIDREWRRIVENFSWASPATSAFFRLSKKQKINSQSISKLLGFKVTNGWLSLMEPRSQLHTLVPSSIFKEILPIAYSMNFSLFDFYLFLIDSVFRMPANTIAQDKEISDLLNNVSKSLIERSFEYYEKKENELIESETNKNQLNFESDDEFDKKANFEEDRDEKFDEIIQSDVEDLITMSIKERGQLFIQLSKNTDIDKFVPVWESIKWGKKEYAL